MAEQQRFQFISPESQRIRQQNSPKQQFRASSEVRGQVLGAESVAPTPIRGRVGNAPDTDRATIKAIQVMGQAIIDPMVERRQQQEFMEGARRQIEGEALQDIVQSQPWYSKIFGPSASVQGARTMAEMQAVEGFTSEIERDMPELRKLNPEQFGQEVLARMEQHSDLGDSATNVAVQAQIMESYGPLVRSHTKEHHAFVQEDMQNAFTGSMLTSGRAMSQNLQGLARGTMSQQDAQIVTQNALNALQPIEGQNANSYWSGIKSASEVLMSEGNFHFVNLIEDHLYESMPAKDKIEFRNNRRKYENQARSDMSAGPFALRIAQLKAQSAEGLISPDAAWQGIQAINQEFRINTGLDRDLLDGGDAEGILTNNLRGLISERKKAQAAAADNQQKMREIEASAIAAQQAVIGGYANSYIDQGASRGEVQSAAWSTVQQQRVLEEEGVLEPGTWARTAVNAHTGDGFKVDALSNVIQSGARRSIGSDLNPAFMASYDTYKALRDQPEGGVGVARSYAGEYADQFESFHQMAEAGHDPNAAFQLTFNEAPTRSPASKEQEKELMEYISDQTNPAWYQKVFGSSVALTESSRAVVARHVADDVAGIGDSTPGLSNEGRFNIGWQSAQTGVDVVGRHAISRGSSGQVKLSNFLGRTPEETGEVFDRVFTEHARASGISSIGNYQIQQLADHNVDGVRTPRYSVMIEDDDHFVQYLIIDGDEIRTEAESGGIRKRNRAEVMESVTSNPLPSL